MGIRTTIYDRKNQTFHTQQHQENDAEKGRKLKLCSYLSRNGFKSKETRELCERHFEYVIRRPKNEVIPERRTESKICGGKTVSSELKSRHSDGF